MPLTIAQIIRTPAGRYWWSAAFDGGAEQEGEARTFGEAREAMAEAVEREAVEEMMG